MSTIIRPLNSVMRYKYVVTFARYGGKWLFSRHKERDTWETQGGHAEADETPLEAARRELYEESGAAEFEIIPLFDYQAADESLDDLGQVFFAEIHTIADLPDSEMAEVRIFDGLPDELTYPDITPVLFDEVCAWMYDR